MTIAVGARWTSGVVVGADSRLMGDAGDTSDDSVAKVMLVPGYRMIVAAAGDLRFDVKPNSGHATIPILDSLSLASTACSLVNGDPRDALRQCIQIHEEVGALLHLPAQLEFLFAASAMGAPELWSISRTKAKGSMTTPHEVTANPPVLGIGQYAVYELLATFPETQLSSNEISRIRKASPPVVPSVQFTSSKDAECWVRAVISWCCAQFNDCGGPIVVHRL